MAADAGDDSGTEVEEIGPHPGPQTKALASPADILIFGGSAGGGKSYVLELEATRHIGNPLFRAVYFRRQAVDLMAPKGLWDTSQLIYPHIGGKAREDKLRWTFDSGAWLKFGHLQLEKDKYSHQGAEYPLIAFDELNHFTESQFWYLSTRNRAPKRARIRPYIRASTNPDPDSWVRAFIDWWIGKDGFPIPERDGVLRWFARDGDDIIWGDSPADVQRQAPKLFNDRLTPEVVCKSVTFIRSRLSDNPSMGVEYEATLMAADAVTRARLLDGNWNVRHAAGDMFKRKWFPIVGDRAPASARRIRCWDLASTDTKKSDWTAGVLLAEWQGLYWVEDLQVLRGTPADVEQVVARTAAGDGHRVDIYIEQEVASAGVTVIDHYKRRVLKGYSVHPVKVKTAGTKTERAKPASAACQPLTEGLVGLVQVVRDPSWNTRFFDELEGFPTVRGDDVVDAFVGAFNSMQQGVVVYGGRG
jgi:phage terminase large subunit-like protein